MPLVNNPDISSSMRILLAIYCGARGYRETRDTAGLAESTFQVNLYKLIALGLVEKKARGSYILTQAGRREVERFLEDIKTICRGEKH